MKSMLASCVVVLVGLTGIAGQMPKAQPGPEQKRLEHFVGTWKMEGQMQPSPMGPGGPFSGTETCRMFEGGFHLVCDSEGTSAMGQMKGHMMLSYDRAAKTYRYFAINNMPDAEMATGTYAGNTWTWKGEMPLEGGKKLWSQFIITETSPTVHTLKWNTSTDGKKWTTMMEGKRTRQ